MSSNDSIDGEDTDEELMAFGSQAPIKLLLFRHSAGILDKIVPQEGPNFKLEII